MKFGRVVSVLFIAALALSQTECRQVDSRMISQVAEVIRAPDGEHCPAYRYEGIEVLGDLQVGAFHDVCEVVKKQMLADEKILTITNMAYHRRRGASGDVEVKTCTDCNLGIVSGAGRHIRLQRIGTGWEVCGTDCWIS